MLDRKKIIIILIVIILVVVLVLLWWFFFRPGEPLANINQNANTNANAAITSTGQLEQLPPPSPERIEEEKNYPLGLKQLAYSFSERFGSYSSDSRFANLRDLKILMTSKMQKATDDFIASDGIAVDVYEGFDAKALSSELISYSENQAEVLVKTQRAQYLGDKLEPNIFYQDLLLKFVKVGEEWKVDEANWAME